MGFLFCIIDSLEWDLALDFLFFFSECFTFFVIFIMSRTDKLAMPMQYLFNHDGLEITQLYYILCLAC